MCIRDRTYVDDAHAVGVLGVDGRGSASAARRQGQIDVTVGTLGKAFGVAGAFVYGSGTLIQYLVNRARSFIFSTAMMPAQAAAAREALRMIRFEPTHRRCTRLVRARPGSARRRLRAACTDAKGVVGPPRRRPTPARSLAQNAGERLRESADLKR